MLKVYAGLSSRPEAFTLETHRMSIALFRPGLHPDRLSTRPRLGRLPLRPGQGGPPGLYRQERPLFYADYRAGKLVMADYLRFALEPLGACLWRKS